MELRCARVVFLFLSAIDVFAGDEQYYAPLKRPCTVTACNDRERLVQVQLLVRFQAAQAVCDF